MRKFIGGFFFFFIWLCGVLFGSFLGYLSFVIYFFMLESKLLVRLMRIYNLNIVLFFVDFSILIV